MATYAAKKHETINNRHFQIDNRKINLAFLQQGHGYFAILCLYDVCVQRRQTAGSHRS